MAQKQEIKLEIKLTKIEITIIFDQIFLSIPKINAPIGINNIKAKQLTTQFEIILEITKYSKLEASR